MSEMEHGLLLQDQGRLDEAEAIFRSVLAREPENDFIYSRLALCQLNQDKRKKDALESINEAIRIRADQSLYHSIRSLILTELDRTKDAVEAADRAIALDPNDSLPYTAKATAFSNQHRWSEAEKWCRQALALDADNAMAANLLTHLLRVQGKRSLNEAAVEELLANDPENSLAHVNAGWTALQRGDHRTAETHFREALRLDPESEGARDGLLESFRARSIFYRGYLQYCFFMQRFTGRAQWAIIIGLYVLYRITTGVMEKVNPAIAIGIAFLYLALVLWVWLAPGLGNFLVFLDRSARMALHKGEAIQGVAVGGGLVSGILALVGGFVFKMDPLICAGCGLILSTVPAALAFDNESIAGRIVFGGILAYIYGATGVAVYIEAVQSTGAGMSPLIGTLAMPAVLGAVLCTWLGNIPVLRRAKSS